MIQRIQSLYLLVAGALLVTFGMIPDAWALGISESVAWLIPAARVLAALAAILAFACVALYKDRARQRTLIVAAQIATLLTVAAAVGGLFLRDETTAGAYILALAPVVSYVLLRLAQRGVDADIALVKSMDRLR